MRFRIEFGSGVKGLGLKRSFLGPEFRFQHRAHLGLRVLGLGFRFQHCLCTDVFRACRDCRVYI